VLETRRRRLAVPAYFHPDDNAADWAKLATTDVGLVVANICDGPGIVREERWANAFGNVRASGCDVVGYVDTGYLGLTGLRTQRGSTLLDDWLEQILRDVRAWYRLYGDQMTGIFLDQVAESDDGASLAPVFRRLRDDIRRLDARAVTVLNPGVAVPGAFSGIGDVIVTFEGSCADYLAEGPDAGFEPLSWSPGFGQAIWHMVHHTPDAAHAARVVALSRARGADLVYVTDIGGDNPYSSLPSSEIWTSLSSKRGAGVVPRLPTGGWRGGLQTPRQPSIPLTGSELTAESSLIENPVLSRRLHVIEASAEFLVTSSSPRVFLASGRRTVPRWWTGSSPQIAADWMIESNRLYAYAGTGTDWVWTPSGQVTFDAAGHQVRWRVDADRIGLDHDSDAHAAFHVSAPGLREYSSVVIGCTTPTEHASC
jgi:Spherulation-specific family 4